MRDYIGEYWNAIQSGTIVTSKKVKEAYHKIMQDKINPDTWYYDEDRAAHALMFLQKFCKQSKGKDGGKPLELMLWQKALICTVFGFVDAEGNRKYRELFLIVGRKNGKSTLASGTGLYMLYADNEHGPQVVSAATTREQAKISWEEAKKMIKKSPALAKRARPLVGTILTDFNDGEFKPLSSDSSTLDGLNPSAAIMDEMAAWVQGKALYDIIVDGESAREQPLNIMITTAGTVREDIFDQLYEQAEKVLEGYKRPGDPDAYHDDRFLPIIYELDERAEWTNEDAWIKANPGIDVIKSREALRYKVEKARANPMLVKNLLCKDFNIRETSSQAWLTFEEINNVETFDLLEDHSGMIWHGKNADISLSYPRYGIGGCDLASTTDLCAAKVLFTVPEAEKHIFVLSMYWLPEDLLEKKVKEDKIPYDRWVDRGLVRLCPGNSVHYKYVKEWFIEIQEKLDIFIPWIGYDAWSAKYFVEDMQGYFGAQSMIPIRQGKQTLSDPMKRLGNDLSGHLVCYNNNPVDKWCLTNTSYEEDRNGNIQPHKTSKSTRRIDGTAALLDGYTVFLDNKQDYLNMI